MFNLSKTSCLFWHLNHDSKKQRQSLTPRQSVKLTTPLIALLGIVMVLSTLTERTGFAQIFTTDDLEGTWNLHSLVTGYPGDFGGWVYGVMTCDSNGDFMQRSTNRTGEINEVNGTLVISPDGIITISGATGLESTFHGVMNSDKNIIAGTQNYGSGGYNLIVWTRTGGIFTTSDLEGIWNLHALGTLSSFGGWIHGIFTFDSSGDFTGSWITSRGHSESPRGTFNIDVYGVIEALYFGGLTGTFHGVMCKNKGMMVSTGTGGDGSYQLHIFVKTGGTFSISDLSGTWHWHGLATGDNAAWKGWFYGTTIVDSNGGFSMVPGSYLNSSGETDATLSGTMSVTNDGIVTILDTTNTHGTMNIDKDMIVMTMDDGGGGYNLIIIVKANADIQAIKDAYEGIEVALETEDIDTLMSYFSADFLHDDKNRNHWLGQFQQLFDNYQNIQVEFTDIQITVNGDAATTTLHVKITGELQDGGAVETITDEDMSEDYLNYWLKEDGIWRLYGNQPLVVPMVAPTPASDGGNTLNIYLYDCVSRTINTVKENSNYSWWPSLNTDSTMMVYTERIGGDPYIINLYEIASKICTTVTTATTSVAACFDKSGKILFIDSSTGILKKMNTNGTNMTTVANPQSPYSFSVFWISPDREKILVVENREEGWEYETGNYERLVLMNSDGTDRAVIIEEYLGEWNILSWKPDSSGFLYYHHLFNGLSGENFEEFAKYFSFDLSGDTIAINNLSDSDIGKEENVCFYTKTGNLLSLTYRELYDGQTGTLIADRSSDVPLFTKAMFGFDNNGNIYFADLNGSNFRKFVEIPADLNNSQ